MKPINEWLMTYYTQLLTRVVGGYFLSGFVKYHIQMSSWNWLSAVWNIFVLAWWYTYLYVCKKKQAVSRGHVWEHPYSCIAACHQNGFPDRHSTDKIEWVATGVLAAMPGWKREAENMETLFPIFSFIFRFDWNVSIGQKSLISTLN